MKIYVAVTDQEWFDFLSRHPDLDEVNFWTPNPWGGEFKVLDRGDLLLFKLKQPMNAIGGGGFFWHYSELPISMAWAAFGKKNGAGSLEATRERISRLRRETPRPWDDYQIGCILLVDPFFWEPRDWIPQPPDWQPQIVRGKSYDPTEGVGRQLLSTIHDRLGRDQAVHVGLDGEASQGYERRRYPSPRRIGQGSVRIVLTDIYHRRCAVTGEKALPTLEAAEIRPAEPTENVQNRILMRADVHRLFDSGYLTVTPQYRSQVSSRLREDFDDGENYMPLHGRTILLPERHDLHPDPKLLAWHNSNVFRG